MPDDCSPSQNLSPLTKITAVALMLFASSVAGNGQDKPTFSPATASGLVLWLDAADLSTLFIDTAMQQTTTQDGQAIAGWRDKSSAGNHATQSESSRRPVYFEDQRNGLSALRFDGLGQFLNANSFGPNFENQSWTAFLVLQANSGAEDGSALMSIATPESYRRGFRFMKNCQEKRCLEFKSKAKMNDDIRTDFSISGKWQIWEFANTAGTVVLSVDGDEIARDEITTEALSGFHTTAIGGRPKRDSASEIWDGHIGEILFYAEALETDTLNSVRGFLADKWQIDLVN